MVIKKQKRLQAWCVCVCVCVCVKIQCEAQHWNTTPSLSSSFDAIYWLTVVPDLFFANAHLPPPLSNKAAFINTLWGETNAWTRIIAPQLFAATDQSSPRKYDQNLICLSYDVGNGLKSVFAEH